MSYNNHPQRPTTIYTPDSLSQFIFELLNPHFPNKKITIFDPCSGQGSLLKPWKDNGYQVWGVDNDSNSKANELADFFSYQVSFKQKVGLILCNPPFNGMKPYLAPEIWLDKIIEIFGKNVPIVLFAPIRLRLCSSIKSKRYLKWTKGIYPPISSIISLPTKDIFVGVDCFSEILIFNVKELKGHYFYDYKN